MEKVLDSRLYYNRGQYKVKWVGFDEPSWQPAIDLENAPDKVNSFHFRHPKNLGHGISQEVDPREGATVTTLGTRTPASQSLSFSSL